MKYARSDGLVLIGKPSTPVDLSTEDTNVQLNVATDPWGSINREIGSSDLAYLKVADLSICAFPDFQEGVKAFFEGKEPRFKGR